MKVRKLVKKLNQAEVDHDLEKVKQLWLKLLKKSLAHKHTEQAQ